MKIESEQQGVAEFASGSQRDESELVTGFGLARYPVCPVVFIVCPSTMGASRWKMVNFGIAIPRESLANFETERMSPYKTLMILEIKFSAERSIIRSREQIQTAWTGHSNAKGRRCFSSMTALSLGQRLRSTPSHDRSSSFGCKSLRKPSQNAVVDPSKRMYLEEGRTFCINRVYKVHFLYSTHSTYCHSGGAAPLRARFAHVSFSHVKSFHKMGVPTSLKRFEHKTKFNSDCSFRSP